MPAIVNSKIAALNAATVLTKVAATSTVVDATEAFVYTPTGKDSKVFFEIENGPTHGTVAYSFSNGDGVFASGAVTGTVAQATTSIVQIETGIFTKTNGTIEVVFTPATGKRLATDHALKVAVIEGR
jgi:hypothetical protein